MSSSGSEGLSRTLVLNGLHDLRGDATVLADDASREKLEAAFEDALHVAERDRFEAEIDDALSGELDEGAEDFIQSCAEDVLAALVEADVSVTLTHDARLSVSEREAAVYSFMLSSEPDALESLDTDADASEQIDEGAEAVAAGQYERAIEAFESAVSVSSGGDGALAARVLAGHACHLAGRDEDAMHYVEEALHLDTGCRTAKLVGYAADHRYPEKFRSRKLGARLFFRWSAGVPDVGDVSVAVGPADGETAPLEGSEQCKPLPRLWPETTVRVEVSGELPALPAVESYYVASGVADLEVYEARSVEEVVLSGPTDAAATELVRFR
jgi:tetratricopeptide (TPR) repeat protein